LLDGDKILDKRRCNKNIIEAKRGRRGGDGGGGHVGDREPRTIADGNEGL
jgi:hypothetical protein